MVVYKIGWYDLILNRLFVCQRSYKHIIPKSNFFPPGSLKVNLYFFFKISLRVKFENLMQAVHIARDLRLLALILQPAFKNPKVKIIIFLQKNIFFFTKDIKLTEAFSSLKN